MSIRRTLESVLPVADEVVVVDSGSTDQTAGICRELGCRVIVRPFDGYGMQKQFAVDQASHDWILSLDADEVVTPALRDEIRALLSSPDSLTFAGYRIPRSLVYLGRVLRHGGAGGERLLRLFDRKKGRFTPAAVHEEIVCDAPAGDLKGELMHYSYRDLSHHLEKLNHYSSLAAGGYRTSGRRFSSLLTALRFPVSFFIFYILKGGILDGYPGFMWSFMAGVYGTLKVAKSREQVLS